MSGAVNVPDAARGMTYEQAAPIIERVALALSDNQGLAGDVLALLAVAAFSGAANANAEAVFINLQSQLMPYLTPVHDAADAFVSAVLDGARS